MKMRATKTYELTQLRYKLTVQASYPSIAFSITSPVASLREKYVMSALSGIAVNRLGLNGVI